MTISDDPTVIESQRRGIAGTGMTEARALQIESDHDTLLARPVITDLDAVPDVILTGLAEGHVLTYNAALDVWQGSPPQGGISEVNTVVDPFKLSFSNLFTVTESAAGVAAVVVNLGTTATTVAAGNHVHNYTKRERVTWAPSGNLSSGVRLLGTFNLVLLAGVEYVLEAELKGRVRGAVNSSYYTERITINGVASTSEIMQCVGGVPADLQHEANQTLTGTGAAIAITAELIYSSGDATDVRAGKMIVRAWPRR